MIRWILGVLIVCFGAWYILREEVRKGASRRKAGFKIVPTTLCALLALAGALHTGQAWAWLLFAGLSVCIAADWLLEFHFLAGMGAFALAHLCYCSGYLLAGPFRTEAILIFAVLFGSLLVVYSRIHRNLEHAPLILCYACILCVMASLACTRSPLLMAGALLFVISDTMIGLRMALKIEKRIYSAMVMLTYYLAQFLIALSAFS